jgi:UDP-N-acetylmuramyl pentapeptide synthase
MRHARFEIAQLQQLTCRSRSVERQPRVQPGDVFVAMPGERVDARTLIPQAIAAGARL